jgi:hypothetical protein
MSRLKHSIAEDPDAINDLKPQKIPKVASIHIMAVPFQPAGRKTSIDLVETGAKVPGSRRLFYGLGLRLLQK